MISLRQIAELNNNGATMIVQEQDRDAFETLQRALRIMEARTAESSERDTPDPAPSTPQDISTSASSSDRSSTNAARFSMDTKCSTEIPSLRDDRFFIFNQAFLIETGDTTMNDNVDDCSQSVVCFYTSVIIFNLALAYHKKGMTAASSSDNKQQYDRSRLSLGQSLRLYEYCLKIVESIANYSEDCKLLLYACSYNLAQLYCRKGERSRAQQLVDGLEPREHHKF